MRPKYLPEEEIESVANFLLFTYGEEFGPVVRPPVPVDEMLECNLKLHFGFGDLPRVLGVPDALGATWIHERKVIIDQSLDPAEHPERRGRYRFTVGHEIGHWELHSPLFRNAASQGQLFGVPKDPTIVCRARSSRNPLEWQANTFAACLLMPATMVFNAWVERQGSLASYVADKEIAELSTRWKLGESVQPTVEIARDLAREFHVSGQAMQIRLIGLQLIEAGTPSQKLFAGLG